MIGITEKEEELRQSEWRKEPEFRGTAWQARALLREEHGADTELPLGSSIWFLISSHSSQSSLHYRKESHQRAALLERSAPELRACVKGRARTQASEVLGAHVPREAEERDPQKQS